MSEQLAIDTGLGNQEPSPYRPLTPRQRLTFDYVRAHAGVTADEVGALLHAHRDRRPHSLDERCEWCARDGRNVLHSKALKPLVTYKGGAGQNGRLGRVYIARNPGDRSPAAPSLQTDSLPGDTWEDIFPRPDGPAAPAGPSTAFKEHA